DRRMKAVARPNGEPSARADDAGDARPFGADRARRREKLGGERCAVLDAAGLEARLEAPDFGARDGGGEGRHNQGGNPEHGSDPVPMHRGKIRGFVACVELPARPTPKAWGPESHADRPAPSTGLDAPPGLRLNA